MATISVIYDALDRERKYQDSKWGTIKEHPHTVGEWLLIVQGELDEAINAWQKGKGDAGALEELLQVMAVCRACFEQCGVVERAQIIGTTHA